MSETNSQTSAQDAAARTRRTQAQMAEARGDVPISDTTLARIIEITEQRIATRPNPMSLDTFEQIEAFAERAARSQMVPRDYQGKPDNIILAVMQGKELGLPPIQAIQSIAMVNGRPSVWGDAVPGLCYASRLLEDHQEYYEGTEGQDDFTAVCKVKRKGVASLKEGRFSQGDAKKAGLFGQATHGKYPKDMSMWRARHRAFHAAFPDVLKGIGTRELESEDAIATPGWTMPVPEKGWFSHKPQAQSDGWDDTWFSGVVQKLAGEPNAWKWLDLFVNCIGEAPTIRDVEEINDLPIVQKTRETAPTDALNAMDAEIATARIRLAEKPKDPTATFTDRREPVTETTGQTAETTTPTQDQQPPVERDSAGIAWDAARHASSKARNTDGTWRARRGVGAQEASQTAQEPAEDSLPFDRWDTEQPATIPSAAILKGGKVNPIPVGMSAFEAWLLDHEGEGIGDDPHNDPVKWAHAYVAAKADLFPADMEAFETNNHDAAREAMIASTEVSGILAPKMVTDSPKAVMGAEPMEIDPAFVPAPTKPTKTEYDSYAARFGAVLVMEKTPEWLNRVINANADVYEHPSFPAVRRNQIRELINYGQQAISPTPTGNSTQTFTTLADGVLLDIASLESVGQWDAWRKAAPVVAELERLKADPDLHQKVMDAADVRRQVLAAPKAVTPTELFEELKAKALACKTTDEAAQLQADKDFLGKVAIMHKADATLWPKLRQIAMAHIEAVKARGPT